MQGEVEQLLRLGNLHEVALVDNADPVGNEPDDGQVMGNEQIGSALLLLELLQQVQHLGPDGHVQSGDGLVGYHQLRLHNHGPGQTDTLPLAAGELMGIPGQVLGEQADFVDHLLHLGHTVGLVFIQVEIVQALGNDIIHGGPLVQGGGGVLEDHLDIPDDLPVQGVGNLAGNPDALIQNLTGGAGVDPDYGTADGGLAGA